MFELTMYFLVEGVYENSVQLLSSSKWRFVSENMSREHT